MALQGQHIRYVTIGHGQIFMKYEHRHLASLGDHAPSTGLPYVSHGHPVVVGHSFQDVLGILMDCCDDSSAGTTVFIWSMEK